MKTNGNDKALEAYKVFPYVAWTVTILFAVFVYNITLELKEVTTDLQAQTDHLNKKLGERPDLIEDFEQE